MCGNFFLSQCLSVSLFLLNNGANKSTHSTMIKQRQYFYADGYTTTWCMMMMVWWMRCIRKTLTMFQCDFFFFFSRLFLYVFLFYFPNIWIAIGRSRLHQFFSTVGSIQFIRVSVEYYFFVSFEFRSEIFSMFFFLFRYEFCSCCSDFGAFFHFFLYILLSFLWCFAWNTHQIIIIL